MSRIPNIVNAINEVFENTSGFELDEFDGDTTFFEMGLDSLVLTQTATALKKEMGYEVTFRQLQKRDGLRSHIPTVAGRNSNSRFVGCVLGFEFACRKVRDGCS